MYDEKIALASCVILIIAMIAMSAFAVTADQIEIIEKSESPVYYAPYWVRCPECEKSGLGRAGKRRPYSTSPSSSWPTCSIR